MYVLSDVFEPVGEPNTIGGVDMSGTPPEPIYMAASLATVQNLSTLSMQMGYVFLLVYFCSVHIVFKIYFDYSQKSFGRPICISTLYYHWFSHYSELHCVHVCTTASKQYNYRQHGIFFVGNIEQCGHLFARPVSSQSTFPQQLLVFFLGLYVIVYRWC